MALQLVTGPTQEPVLLAEAKAHCRVTVADDDGLMAAYILAARSACENYTRRSLCIQTWRATFDAFPGPSLFGVPAGVPYSLPGHAIILERPPIRSITSITYTAMDGTTQTMPTTDYTDATLSGTRRCDDPVRITPTFGKIWPITLPQIDSVAVTYVAGYDGLDIPHELRAWILLRAAAMYDNREEIVVDNRVAIDPLPFASQFLDTYRIEIF